MGLLVGPCLQDCLERVHVVRQKMTNKLGKIIEAMGGRVAGSGTWTSHTGWKTCLV